MKIWIAALRIMGIALMGWGVFGAIPRVFLTRPLLNWNDLQFYALSIIHSLALALLCFGAASALKTLRRIDERTAHQSH